MQCSHLFLTSRKRERRTNDELGNRMPLFAFAFVFVLILPPRPRQRRTNFRIGSTVLFPDFRRQFDLSVAHASGSYLSLNLRFHCVPRPVLFSHRNRPWPRLGPQRHSQLRLPTLSSSSAILCCLVGSSGCGPLGFHRRSIHRRGDQKVDKVFICNFWLVHS